MIKKKRRLTAIEKTERAFQILKSEKWILDFKILPVNSLDDSLGYDTWVSFQENGCKQGKLGIQVLSKNIYAKRHMRKHCGVPHISARKGDTIRDTVYRFLLFLFVHRALNTDKVKGLEDGMSLLCPLKYCKS